MPDIEVAIDVLPKELANRIRQQEKKDGYCYGGAVYALDNGRYSPCFVSVTFYPSTKWWIRIGDEDRKPLTDEDYARVSKLQL